MKFNEKKGDSLIITKTQVSFGLIEHHKWSLRCLYETMQKLFKLISNTKIVKKTLRSY